MVTSALYTFFTECRRIQLKHLLKEDNTSGGLSNSIWLTW